MERGILEKLNEVLDGKVKQQVVLRDHASLGVGGVADYFFACENTDELIKAVTAAQELGLRYFVLGQGNGLLISDYGVPALVIKNCAGNIAYLYDKSQVIVDSGVSISRLAMETASRGLAGLEPFSILPGTLGGAIYRNVTVNGLQISSVIKSVTLLVYSEGESKVLKYKPDWFKFNPLVSRLIEHPEPKPIILSVKLQLARNKNEDIMRRLAQYKKQFGQYSNREMRIMMFKDNNRDYPVGLMIKQLSTFRMKRKELAFDTDANILINRGKADAHMIRELVQLLQHEAQEKLGVFLDEQIEYVGALQEEIDDSPVGMEHDETQNFSNKVIDDKIFNPELE